MTKLDLSTLKSVSGGTNCPPPAAPACPPPPKNDCKPNNKDCS